MASLSWWKPARPRITRKLWSSLMQGLFRNSREQKAELLEQAADQKGVKKRHFAWARSWNPAEDGSPTGFHRGRHRSNGGTSRLWRSPIQESPGTPKQWSLVATNRSILALSCWPFVKNCSNYRLRKSEKKGGHVRGGQESEDKEKRWWTKFGQLANIILVMVTNLWPGHLHLGNNGVRTKRVSVQIGKHQLIGSAQTHCVNDPNGDHRVPGSHHSQGSEEWVPHLRRHVQGHPWLRK